MKRVFTGIALLLVASLGITEVVMAEAPETEPEVQTKVRIEIGQASFGYRDHKDAKTRLPEVPIGEYFKVKVKWVRDAARVRVLKLNNFRYLVLDPEAAVWETQESETRLWLKRDGKEAATSEVVFSTDGSDEADLKFEYPELTGALLIFFDVELKDGESRVFFFDPPWAGKRGSG
jgi:hypothetical protein